MWRDFEGGIDWDELAEICSDILSAAGFRGAVNTVYVVWLVEIIIYEYRV